MIFFPPTMYGRYTDPYRIIQRTCISSIRTKKDTFSVLRVLYYSVWAKGSICDPYFETQNSQYPFDLCDTGTLK